MERIKDAIRYFKGTSIRSRELIYINGVPYYSCYGEGDIDINGFPYRKASEADMEELFKEFIFSRPYHLVPFVRSRDWAKSLRKAIEIYSIINGKPVQKQPEDPLEEVHEVAAGGWRGLADYFATRLFAREVLDFAISAVMYHLELKLPFRVGDIEVSSGFDCSYLIEDEHTGEIIKTSRIMKEDDPPYTDSVFKDVIGALGMEVDVGAVVPQLMTLEECPVVI